MNKIKKIRGRARSGFSLVLVLVILLMASVFISVSFYLVENYTSVSFKQTIRLDTYNLAISGLEKMKAELEDQLNQGNLPVAKSSVNGWVSSSDLNGTYDFDGLIAATSDWEGSFSGDISGYSVQALVYDLTYKTNDIEYSEGIPPQYESTVTNDSEGTSEKEENYDGSGGTKILSYMIRCTVTDKEGRSKTVEQVIRRTL